MGALTKLSTVELFLVFDEDHDKTHCTYLIVKNTINTADKG